MNGNTARFKETVLVGFRHLRQHIDENPLSRHQAHIVKLTLVEREINNILNILEDAVPEKQLRVLDRIETLKVKLEPTRKWFGKSEARKLINLIEAAAIKLPASNEDS